MCPPHTSLRRGCLLPLSQPPTPACSQGSEDLNLAARSGGTALRNLLQLVEGSLLPLHSLTNEGQERRSQSSDAVVAPKG